MNSTELKNRMKQFSLRIIKVVDALPNTTSSRAIANQLIRSGTSIGANYHAACRGRSKSVIYQRNIFSEKTAIVVNNFPDYFGFCVTDRPAIGFCVIDRPARGNIS
ncbi:MAG: four helix bundle protein [Planctomycetaceae bacterium]|jgi:hypothetical protein|nr:four helix bundle protein [Planctomycetaceae bacterium]